ncbi:MAG: STM4012 family radical SAM protein [Planctomycetaceae bacterium]
MPNSPDRNLPSAISELLSSSPYQSYTYAYPHKTAYRRFDQPVCLKNLWDDEDRRSLFLYLHVPFCEHRCGFCNLFTQANPEDGLTERYLRQLKEEAERVRGAIQDAQITRLAIGGGTPTFLDLRQLEQLLEISTRIFDTNAERIPVSVEVSPATVDRDKLTLLRRFGTDRVSIGIQSFRDDEAHRLGRPQRSQDVFQALELIRDLSFPVLNIDLIYGGEGQTSEQWLDCLREALTWSPEELYLYPLYVRPLTGLGRLDRHWDDQRLEAYQLARDLLLSYGFQQVSMRMFQAKSAAGVSSSAPTYCCQTDGMIGLGCGARSYTRNVHYSTEYAVSRRGVKSVLADYLNRAPTTFSSAQYGDRLPIDDQQRRFLIMSLLQADGLVRSHYQRRFQEDVLEHFPELGALRLAGLLTVGPDAVQLTPTGLERSDAIGPWLYSTRVKNLMDDYELH